MQHDDDGAISVTASQCSQERRGGRICRRIGARDGDERGCGGDASPGGEVEHARTLAHREHGEDGALEAIDAFLAGNAAAR